MAHIPTKFHLPNHVLAMCGLILAIASLSRPRPSCGRVARKLPVASEKLWPHLTHPAVGCMTCLFYRQVYAIEIESP